jgi:hypothetical protein
MTIVVLNKVKDMLYNLTAGFFVLLRMKTV